VGRRRGVQGQAAIAALGGPDLRQVGLRPFLQAGRGLGVSGRRHHHQLQRGDGRVRLVGHVGRVRLSAGRPGRPFEILSDRIVGARQSFRQLLLLLLRRLIDDRPLGQHRGRWRRWRRDGRGHCVDGLLLFAGRRLLLLTSCCVVVIVVKVVEVVVVVVVQLQRLQSTAARIQKIVAAIASVWRHVFHICSRTHTVHIGYYKTN